MEFSSTLEVNKKATISLSGFESKVPLEPYNEDYD